MAAHTSVDTLATSRPAPSAGPVGLRLTVVGDAGRADLVAPPATDVATLARTYAEHVGAAASGLLTAAGAPLAAGRSLADCGVQHGDLLVAVAGSAATPGSQWPAGARSRPSGVPGRVSVTALAAAAGCGLTAAALVAAGPGAGAAAGRGDGSAVDLPRLVCLLLLIACAAVSALPLTDRTVRARTATGPAFAAAAGFVVVGARGPGGLLLGLAVAALCAAVAAAVARAFLDDDLSDLLAVWLAVGSTGAVLSVALLLAGGSAQALLAVPYAAAVVAMRLLPSLVLDVPDEALLDLDRLSVTAWSPREQHRSTRRRRSVVRAAGVRSVVRRGRRLLEAGSVAAALVVAVTGPVLVMASSDQLGHQLADQLGDGSGSRMVRIGSLVMVGLGAVALALVARAFRAALPRLVLRCAAVAVLLVLGTRLLLDAEGSASLWWFAALVATAAVASTCGVLLGRGWRSLWWGRVADVTEGLAVVLVVALVPIASGGFDAIERFMS